MSSFYEAPNQLAGLDHPAFTTSATRPQEELMQKEHVFFDIPPLRDVGCRNDRENEKD
jgi:hypothetical protein